jgi:hypothetical protein
MVFGDFVVDAEPLRQKRSFGPTPLTKSALALRCTRDHLERLGVAAVVDFVDSLLDLLKTRGVTHLGGRPAAEVIQP